MESKKNPQPDSATSADTPPIVKKYTMVLETHAAADLNSQGDNTYRLSGGLVGTRNRQTEMSNDKLKESEKLTFGAENG